MAIWEEEVSQKTIRQALGSAMQIVDSIPEDYRGQVLPVVLAALLESERGLSPKRVRQVQAPSTADPAGATEARQEWEDEVIGGVPEPHLVAEGTRVQQAVWAIIRLRQKGKAADVGSINEVIKDELGVSPQEPSNTSRTLGRLTPRLATREKGGRGYAYRPSRHSLEVFSDLTKESE